MNWSKNTGLLIIVLTTLTCGTDQLDDDKGGNPELVYTLYQASIERDSNPAIADSEYLQLVYDNNQFAVKLFQTQYNPSADGSFFSPFSISTVLAMTYAGARGDTQTEMAEALEFNLPPQALHAGFNRSLTELDQHNMPQSPSHPALEVVVANALWPYIETPPAPPFLDTLASQYGAGIYGLDYAQQPELSRQAINDQVEQWTHGYITDLLPDDSVDPSTRLVITSSIYFFAPWEDSFLKQNTSPRPFQNLDGTTVDVPTMSTTAGVYFSQTEDANFGSLIFRDGALQMLFIVPTGDFTDYVANLSAAKLSEGVTAMRYATGVVRVPKFKFESDNSIADRLRELGMQKAFNSEADFSAMGLGEVYIGDIRHKAIIDVNEAGTTAAAASAVLILPPSVPPNVLTVDRPFIYMIYDRASNTILFMGHMANF